MSGSEYLRNANDDEDIMRVGIPEWGLLLVYMLTADWELDQNADSTFVPPCNIFFKV